MLYIVILGAVSSVIPTGTRLSIAFLDTLLSRGEDRTVGERVRTRMVHNRKPTGCVLKTTAVVAHGRL